MSESLREAELQQRNERLERENAFLRQKIDALIRQLFGRQSEQLDSGQLQLLLQGVAEVPTPEPAAPADPALEVEPASPRPLAKHERTARLPEHLPDVEATLDPEPVQACPSAWRYIGQEVTKRLQSARLACCSPQKPSASRRTSRRPGWLRHAGAQNGLDVHAPSFTEGVHFYRL